MIDGDFVLFPLGEFKALSTNNVHWTFVDAQSWRNYDSDCRRADRIGNGMAYPEKHAYLRYLRLADGRSIGTLAEWKIAINSNTTWLDAKPERK